VGESLFFKPEINTGFSVGESLFFKPEINTGFQREKIYSSSLD